MSLCIITPNLPPAIDGIGDYSRRFWQQWNSATIPNLSAELNEINFLVLNSAVGERAEMSGARISSFSADKTSVLDALNASGSSHVLLQYSGYGYDRNGIPSWLCDGLEFWKSADPKRRVCVNFHENWAAGPPWKKVFWLQRHQIRCAQRLLKVSNNAATSNQAILRQLEQLGVQTPIALIPIGANFLLPNVLPPRSYRRLLAIGREGARLRAVRTHLRLLAELHAKQLIDELVLAGELIGTSDAALELVHSQVRGLRVTTAYNFPVDSVPESVLSAGSVLMHTETACILKSGSFHFAVASQQVPIALLDKVPEPPLDLKRHLLAYPHQSPDQVVQQFDEAHLSHLSENLAELHAMSSWDSIVRQWHGLITAN